MFDEELAAMVNYTDETVPAEMPVMERKAKEVQYVPQKEEPSRMVVAEENPFPKPKRGTMDRLLEMCIWMLVCGMISYTMWWFEVNNLMAMEASYPCVLISAIVGAAGTTWSAMRK